MIFRVYELYDGIIYRHLYTFVNLCSWNFLTSKAHFFKIYLWTFLTFSATQKNLTPRSLECPWGDGGQRVCRAWFLLRAVRQSQLRPESLKWKVTEAVNQAGWWETFFKWKVNILVVGSYEKKESEDKKPDDFFQNDVEWVKWKHRFEQLAGVLETRTMSTGS